jgi:phosphoribosyl-AMP cyclohydrolase
MKLMKKVSMAVVTGMSLLPIQVFAHGTEDEHKKEIALSTYVLAGSAIVFIVFLALFFMTRKKARQLNNAKKQEDREKRQQLSKTANVLKWVSIVALVATVISGGVALSKGSEGTNNGSISVEGVTLPDLHGLGYSPDGGSIMLPAHDGIKLYSEGRWSDGPGAKHDYMGFSAVSDGFYSSGHPAQGSNKKNPFGIVKSTDGGNSFKTLTLYGKVDFHLMNVSFNKHTIYVVNPQSNSEMKGTGLFYSKDEAKTWIKSKMDGFSDEPAALAVHPDNDGIVALGSQQGLYISKDYGDQFEKVSDIQVTSLYFNPQGKLFVGEYNQGATLTNLDIESGERTDIPIPSLEKDAVMYFAQNPVDEKEWVFATFNKDVYLSQSQGSDWKQIAVQGTGISP